MSFEPLQLRRLRAKLKPGHIRSRVVDGTQLHYLEGWHVIAEANRIFGFDGWDRETVETKCVWTKQNGTRFSAAYLTRVRISVQAGEARIFREGSGAGEAHEATAGLAHERAAKAAETDATKRALMTFGNAFGLSLYGESTSARKGANCLPDRAPNSTTQQIAQNAEGRSATNRCPNRPNRNVKGDIEGPGIVPARADAIAESEGGYSSTGQNPATSMLDKSTQPLQHQATTAPPWPTVEPLEEAARIAQARGRIDKSQLALSEPHRARDKDHLRQVASRSCMVCGRSRCQAHHLTYLQPRAMGRKVSDEFTVPLCSIHHRELHAHGNEQSWWQSKKIDPQPLARQLWMDRNGTD